MYITLCNTQFDRENDNVLLFDSKASLKTYFDNLQNKVPIVKEINFDAKDIISTSVYVDVPNTTALLQLLNYNYCFLDQATGKNTSDRLYYFIERSYQDGGNRIRLDLRLDWWNTYVYDIMGENKPLQALIQKTHLDRYIKSGNDYIYNFKADSPLFERETIKDVAKRAVSKQKLKMQIDTTAKDSDFNNYINNNIVAWKYYFLDPTPTYKYRDFAGTQKQTQLLKMTYNKASFLQVADSGLVVLCAPIYKNTNYKIRIVDSLADPQRTVDWTENGLLEFLYSNNLYANVKSIKYSIMPPLPVMSYTANTAYKIINNNLALPYTLLGGDGFIQGYDNDLLQVCLAVYKQYIGDNYQLKLFIDSNLSNWKYTKAQIKASYQEPKLENEDYSTYKLVFAGNDYDLPIGKTSPRPQFIYREVLTPDITKALLTYDTTVNEYSDSVLKDITKNDFSGFSLTLDLSMWYYTSQLETYIANNKNYLQIFKNSQNQRVASGIISAGAGLIGGTLAGNFGGALIAGGVATQVNAEITNAFKQAEFDMTIDNMKNAPGTINNINSNPVLIDAITELGIYIERLEALPFESELVKDNLKMFGYSYNRIGDIYTHIKTRKYYNYIQAIIFDIDAHISEQVKDVIKQSFRNGIRVWHADAGTAIDFTTNNYERFLDNE